MLMINDNRGKKVHSTLATAHISTGSRLGRLKWLTTIKVLRLSWSQLIKIWKNFGISRNSHIYLQLILKYAHLLSSWGELHFTSQRIPECTYLWLLYNSSASDVSKTSYIYIYIKQSHYRCMLKHLWIGWYVDVLFKIVTLDGKKISNHMQNTQNRIAKIFFTKFSKYSQL